MMKKYKMGSNALERLTTSGEAKERFPRSIRLIKGRDGKIRKAAGFRIVRKHSLYKGPSVFESDEQIRMILSKKADYRKPSFLCTN